MRLELLYPEITTMLGDNGNLLLLERAFAGHQIVETSLYEPPAFLDNKVDFLYMGALAQESKAVIIEALKPYKRELRRQIESGTVCLFTHESFEVLCDKIVRDNGSVLEGLGLYPFYSKVDLMHRLGTHFIGKAFQADEKTKNHKVLGFRSQFTTLYGVPDNRTLFVSESGFGNEPDTIFEGFRDQNLFATSLVGPFLHFNPYYAAYLFRLLPEDIPIPYEKELLAAYEEHFSIMTDPAYQEYH